MNYSIRPLQKMIKGYFSTKPFILLTAKTRKEIAMEKKPCPSCQGKKFIVGTCECNPEWRTTDADGVVDDCICEPDKECETCGGTGYVEA